MARIFTTTFNFNGQNHHAIVTISTEQDNLNFSIRLMDESLFELIPGGHVKYTGKDGFRHLSTLNDNKLAQSLLRSVVNAIEHYTEEYA